MFAIFYIFGAWPIPDSNEPYYVGKAINYWNPNWIENDTFLQSKDAHWTFYVTFGWLTFFLSPYSLVLLGRAVTWGLLAWSWQRLSFALVPVRWLSILTALAFAYYVDSFHMAGEWVVGGVEGKSLAFPFVLFGLEAMVRGRWHWTWIFLGIASAFHVLVGGWTVLIAGFVWLCTKSSYDQSGNYGGVPPSSPALYKGYFDTAPWGLFLGGAVSLLGLLPVLLLNNGTPQEIIHEAHQIYVFERLHHHLVPYMIPWTYLARFFLLVLFWGIFCRFASDRNGRQKRFDLFVWGSLLLTLIGIGLAYSLRDNRELSAELLRFYWFRLSDVAVPMGVALGGMQRFLLIIKQLGYNFAQKYSQDKLPLGLIGTLLTCFVVTAMGLYLFVDYLIFSQRLYRSTVPEQGIPWLITILILATLAAIAYKKSLRVKIVSIFVLLFVYMAVLFYAPFDSLKKLGDLRTAVQFSRIDPSHPLSSYYWGDACRWIANPENTHRNAKFLVPRDAATFKWHARRSDVGVWKEIPQDAAGIVAWRKTMRDLFFYTDEDGKLCEDRSLTILLWWKTVEELEEIRKKYGFDYILCGKNPELSKHTTWNVVYENEIYRVYQYVGP